MAPTKISEYLLLVTSFLTLASAYTWTGDVYGFGGVNQTAFQQANQNPNATKGVFFQMGNNNYTLRVNVAEFEPTSANTNIQNPRVAASFYELAWSGGSDLNETIRTAESIGSDTTPRLCLSLPLGLFSDSVTNGYKQNDYADCSGALGSDCVNDLKNTGYSLNSPCMGQLPSSCQSKMPDGGVGSSCKFRSLSYRFIAPRIDFSNSTRWVDFISKLVQQRVTNIPIGRCLLFVSDLPGWQ